MIAVGRHGQKERIGCWQFLIGETCVCELSSRPGVSMKILNGRRFCEQFAASTPSIGLGPGRAGPGAAQLRRGPVAGREARGAFARRRSRSLGRRILIPAQYHMLAALRQLLSQEPSHHPPREPIFASPVPSDDRPYPFLGAAKPPRAVLFRNRSRSSPRSTARISPTPGI